MILNQIYTSIDKKRQTRIIKHKGKVIAMRCWRYTTDMGRNSTGEEKIYNTLTEAILKESEWLRGVK